MALLSSLMSCLMFCIGTMMLPVLKTRSESSRVKQRKSSNWLVEVAILFDVFCFLVKYPKSCYLPHGSIPMSATAAGLVG